VVFRSGGGCFGQSVAILKPGGYVNLLSRRFGIFHFGSVFFLVLSASSAAPAQTVVPGGGVTRTDSPLTRDPRKPTTYEIENEIRNSKIGREVEIALRQGNDAYSAKPPRYSDAEEAYRHAAELDPKEARAYMSLGRVYAAQNNVEKTVAFLLKAIEVKPKYAEAHFNLGLVYLAIGNRPEAVMEYEKLLLLDKELAKKLKETLGK